MKVSNMTSSNGNKIATQFIIEDCTIPAIRDRGTMFQSYSSNIVFKYWHDGTKHVLLDRDNWDYSRTTGKYRNQFLGETKAETQKKIDSGEYILINLN